MIDILKHWRTSTNEEKKTVSEEIKKLFPGEPVINLEFTPYKSSQGDYILKYNYLEQDLDVEDEEDAKKFLQNVSDHEKKSVILYKVATNTFSFVECNEHIVSPKEEVEKTLVITSDEGWKMYVIFQKITGLFTIHVTKKLPAEVCSTPMDALRFFAVEEHSTWIQCIESVMKTYSYQVLDNSIGKQLIMYHDFSGDWMDERLSMWGEIGRF